MTKRKIAMPQKAMKIFAVLLSVFIISAQDVSPDFTGTDIHGVTHNLYSILDQGKHVWIHTTGSF